MKLKSIDAVMKVKAVVMLAVSSPDRHCDRHCAPRVQQEEFIELRWWNPVHMLQRCKKLRCYTLLVSTTEHREHPRDLIVDIEIFFLHYILAHRAGGFLYFVNVEALKMPTFDRAALFQSPALHQIQQPELVRWCRSALDHGGLLLSGFLVKTERYRKSVTDIQTNLASFGGKSSARLVNI